ncbi:MAG: hypothetical protein WD278_13735 [Pirellulales bacterium]
MCQPFIGRLRMSGCAVLLFVAPIAGCAEAPQRPPLAAVGHDPDESQQPAEITIVMEGCKASRPAHISSDTSLVGLLFSAAAGEQLVKRGMFEFDGESHAVYLPKPPYSVTNSAESDGGLTNKSTLISIDQNGDAELAEDEGWFASLPVRVGDRMFDVIEIAADGSQVVFKPATAPMQGVVIGRKSPPFSFQTTDGEVVTLEQFKGKTVIFDIWSVT